MDQTNYTNKISAEQVADSIECVACRKRAKFFGVTLMVWFVEVALITYLLSITGERKDDVTMYALLGVMFALGLAAIVYLIINYASRVKTIERGVGVLPIYKVVFENTVKSSNGGICFAVEIPDGSGKVVQTNMSFLANKPDNLGKSFALVPPLYVDDFMGKEVLVMYNPDKNKMYLLGLAANFTLPTDTL